LGIQEPLGWTGIDLVLPVEWVLLDSWVMCTTECWRPAYQSFEKNSTSQEVCRNLHSWDEQYFLHFRDLYALFQPNLVSLLDSMIQWQQFHLPRFQKTKVPSFPYQTNTANRKKLKYFLTNICHVPQSLCDPVKYLDEDWEDIWGHHHHLPRHSKKTSDFSMKLFFCTIMFCAIVMKNLVPWTVSICKE